MTLHFREYMIHVIVVDRMRLLAEAVATILQNRLAVKVVGLTTSAEEALAQLAAVDCHLLLINVNLTEGSALTLVEQAKQNYPAVKILVMGLADTEAVIMRYIEAGALGYTLLQESLEDLLARIEAAVNEEAFVAPEVAAALINRIADLSEMLADVGMVPEHYDELTEREREILTLVASGMTNQEISDQLTIEVGTVKNHIHNIFDKLNVSSRKDASLYLALLQQHEADERPDRNLTK